jgi:hypothetical protein
MARTDYDLIVVSWDGHNINDTTNYKSGVRGISWGLPPMAPLASTRVNNFPIVSKIERQQRIINLLVTITASDKRTARDNLLKWFDPDDETAKNFIVEDADGTNDRYVQAFCSSCVPTTIGSTATAHRDQFNITLATHGDPLWKASTKSEPATWSASSTGETHEWTNSGTADAYPTITVSPTSAKSGTDDYLYKQFIPWRWRAPYGATRYPLDVVDVLDTTSLVETATTSDLDGAINDSVTTISITDASSFPTRGMGYITDAVNGDEQISWTGKSSNDLTGVTRGIGGTSAAQHADEDVIAVSKSMVNGADVRIEVDGVDRDLWITGWNSASSKVWVNTDWSKAWDSTITAAIASGATVTSITVDDSVKDAPSSGVLFINNEAFAYSAKDNKTKTFAISDRATLGTSAGNHSLGDTIWWCQRMIFIKYGNLSASAMSVDADYAPAFDTTNSTNGSWIYGATDFGEDDGLRAGQWQRSTEYGTPEYYGGNQDSAADPWTDPGLECTGREKGRYYLWNPCGITNVNATNGEKWSDNTSDWHGTISSWTGRSWYAEYITPAPSSASTWEAWSQDQAITAGRYKISIMSRAINKSTTNKFELQDCTITLNSNQIPVIGSFSESGMYNLSLTIANNTTGESIALAWKTAVDSELEIDTRPVLEGGKTVTDITNGINAFNALTLVEAHRRDWFKLQPGVNEWEITETGLAGMDITIEFRARFY